MSEGHVMTPMPQYLCHKKVWALKIKQIVTNENGSATITPEEAGYAPFTVAAEFMPKHIPGMPEAGWYYVVYEDGYLSFSPAKAFEDGYTLIQYHQELAYKVEPCLDTDASGKTKGCEHCGAGKMYNIIRPDGVALSTSYEDHEYAVELAEMLSEAYYDGRASARKVTEDDAEFTRGVASVLRIRCMKHRDLPQLNEKEEGGGECPICFLESRLWGLFERRQAEKELVPFFDFLLPADGPVVEGMEEAEVVYAKDQTEYLPLRTLPSNGPERKVLSRWSLMPGQREAVARGADVYLELMTFGHPLTPIRMGIGYKPNPAFIMNLMWPDPSDQPTRKLTPHERMDNFKETFLKAYRGTETVRERADGPPYDGNPCPMCPQNVRNLSATVHNLAWRLESYSGECLSKITEKFQNMKDAVNSVTPSDQWPQELTDLYYASWKASKCETVAELLKFKDSLKAVSNAVRPLSDAHFADRKHSHGDALPLGRPIDELKFKDGSTYGERKENIPGQNAPAKPPDE